MERWARIGFGCAFAYGVSGALQVWLYGIDPHPEIVHRFEMLSFFLKVPALIGLVVLFAAVAERVSERRQRAIAATSVWAATGLVALGFATAVRLYVQRSSSAALWRVWPGDEIPLDAEALKAFDPYVERTVLAYEATALVLVALVAGAVLRLAANGHKAALVGPIAVFGSLIVYQVVAPWSFTSDYDFFVGDALLGSVFGELLFFPLPFDPWGAAMLGVAALTMYGLLQWWEPSSEEAMLADPLEAEPAAAVFVIGS